ncbi:hypothetical protein IGI04_034908 [Brassica rapa subsp. trilocularis]|uniref:CCHC-type domain-containing protein n=1 Tax=Brassica rapa subsp. trilocularis TaxID=1813537 RepID=A0ABQ7LA52_BRACM|nr:hypothetical protein IGI04_034908 [Brassica rapa subsp. trilocularis]
MHTPDLKMLETNSGVRGSGRSFRGKSQASSSSTKEGTLSSFDIAESLQADESSFGLNSQMAEGVQGLKDKDSGAAVDGVNPASGNMLQQEKQKSCTLGTVVENESKKRAHVKQLKMPFVGLIRIICINKTVRYKRRKRGLTLKQCRKKTKEITLQKKMKMKMTKKIKMTRTMFIMKMNMKMKMMMMLKMKMKVTVEMKIKMTLELKMKMKMTRIMIIMAGMSLLEMIVRETKMMLLMDVHQKEGVVDGLVVTVMSVLWSPKLEVKGLEEANGQGGSSSGKQCCNMRHYEDNTDNLRDFVYTSRIIDFSYIEDSDICGSVDVVNVTPPKDRNQQNHDDDSVDRRFTKSSSETVRCALNFAIRNTDVGNVVLVTPPQRNEKRSYFDPTLTDATQVHGGGATKIGTFSCAHNDETPSGESDHIVLVTPHKQYNKHNRIIEADDEFVSPPFTQTTDFEGGEACIPRKHFSSTSVTVSCTQSDETNTGATEGPGKKKKPNKCSRCFKEGHKKTTCKEPVP